MDAGEKFAINLPDGSVTCRLKSKLPDKEGDLRATFIVLSGANEIPPGTYEVEFRGYEPTKADIAPAGIDIHDYALDIGATGGFLIPKN